MNSELPLLAAALAPETVLVIGALVVLGVDLSVLRGASLERRRTVAVALALVAAATALVFSCWIGHTEGVIGGVIRLDRLASATRLGVLALLIPSLALVSGARLLRHPAEYVTLFLLSAAGLSLMALSQNLLVSYLVLEMASLGLYVLAGFDKRSSASAEAGLKYFLSGGLAAAFLLFGLSLIYGLTGSLDLGGIAVGLHMLPASPLLVLALVMVVVALGFKVAAAPFQFWAPDTYQGAPASSVAFIGSAAKLAGLVFFARLLWPALGAAAGDLTLLDWRTGWMPAVAAISAGSLVLGNVGALAQVDVRRILAYSAIAHAGGVLLAVLVAGHAGPIPLYYYALTYGIANVGAFGVVAVLDRAGVGAKIQDLVGLWRRSPLLAGCLLVFLLSLAGVPPLAGFFGKFMVFGRALSLEGLSNLMGWLALLAIAFSVVSLFFYLKVLKPALVGKPSPGAVSIEVPGIAAVVLVLCAAALLVLGVAPQWVINLF